MSHSASRFALLASVAFSSSCGAPEASNDSRSSTGQVPPQGPAAVETMQPQIAVPTFDSTPAVPSLEAAATPPTSEAPNAPTTETGEPVTPPSLAPVDDVLLEPELETPAAPMTPEACVSENAAAEVEPVILAFAFDVSGSMGKGDEPYHERTLKWDPVVEATKAFFGDPNSAGISASLTFFPVDGDDKCDMESYTEPVVALTELPSEDFAAAIDEETPVDEDDWIGGTPTWAVLEGTYAFLQQSLAENPEALHAVVLVTDGEPNGCDDEVEDIGAVAEFVASYSAILPTYVIGVDNPVTEEEPDPPDVIMNLTELAESGGTGSAFLIDTGNADQTAKDFAAAVDAIRGNSISCTITIPAPPSGQTLDTDLVNVTYTGAEGAVELVYSEDCALEHSWYYDDPAEPSTIRLCESTCATVLGDGQASVEVEFGCVRRTTPVMAR